MKTIYLYRTFVGWSFLDPKAPKDPTRDRVGSDKGSEPLPQISAPYTLELRLQFIFNLFEWHGMVWYTLEYLTNMKTGGAASGQ